MEKATSKGFFHGTTPALRIAFLGFVVCVIGVGLGFLGFAIDLRAVSLIGYGVCVVGIAVGFVGIAYGWIRHGPAIVKNVYIHYIKKKVQ